MQEEKENVQLSTSVETEEMKRKREEREELLRKKSEQERKEKKEQLAAWKVMLFFNLTLSSTLKVFCNAGPEER